MTHKTPTTVADALTNPEVRAGKLYFRALDCGAHAPNATALFRLYTDGAQELLGAGRWLTLQRLIEDIKGQLQWRSQGSACNVEWLVTEAELVEPSSLDEETPGKTSAWMRRFR